MLRMMKDVRMMRRMISAYEKEERRSRKKGN
jgi:hypothetical protein